MFFSLIKIIPSSYTDLQDYTYYFVPAPWLSVKLLRLLQNYPPPGSYGNQGKVKVSKDTSIGWKDIF